MIVRIGEPQNIQNIHKRAKTVVALTLPVLQWWEFVKIVGAIGFVALALSFVTGHTPSPAVTAVALHFFTDFTCQSSETARHKSERGRHLLVQALTAGGIPLAVAGLVMGNPIVLLTWVGIGVVSHYAVDWTRKFGLQHEFLGVILDQACHLATILVLTMFVCW